jgi:protein-disulfide isomerase
MGFRIFISLIIIACSYFVFESARVVLLKNAMIKATPEHVLGNPDGDLAFAAFFEYSCSQCRARFPMLNEALGEDQNVKFIPRPLEFIQSDGINPALVVYAAAKQGKFAEMHNALLNNYRVINAQVLQDLALETGIDPTQLKEDVKSDEVFELADQNRKLFERSRFRGAPALIIGKKFWFILSDDFSKDELVDLFRQARGK